MSLNTPNKINFKNQFLKEILILTGTFVISLMIRWIGLKHGFPLLTHPDEGVILDQAYFMTSEGFLFPGNPGNFIRPNQILYVLNYFYLNAMSYIRFGENFAARYQLYQLHFYHYARLLIAILGSLIPLVAYKIGKIFKPGLALPAGLVFMAFPSYVLHSLFITPDILSTLFTLLVIYFTLRYLTKNEEKAIFVAILFSAINTAEKYPGLISLAIVFVGIAIKTLEHNPDTLKIKLWLTAKKIFKAGVVFVAALFLVAPKLFLNYRMVMVGLFHSARSEHPGADELNLLGRLFFYIEAFASWSNVITIIFIFAGCVAIFKWRNKYSLVFFYGILYWICLSVLSLHWERWALPMYITPLFLIAIGISLVWEFSQNKPTARWISLIIITVFFGQQFITAIDTSVQMAFTDTRVIALSYCQANGITTENTLYEGYTPLQERQKPEIIFGVYDMVQSDVDYIILSSSMYQRYYQEPEKYPSEMMAYENIRETNTLIARFEPSPVANQLTEKVDDLWYYIMRSLELTPESRFSGPIIEIYQTMSSQLEK